MAESVYAEARLAAIDLLKKCGEKCFIAFEDWQDMCSAMTGDDVSISIFAIGLGNNGDLCVAATVDNVGYGFSDDDFEQGWASTSGFHTNCFPEIYRFVADNIDKTMTKADADKIVNAMWTDE